jgi:hypothetical protein
VILGEAVGGAKLSLGFTGAVAALIALTLTADIDANEFWVDTGPDAIWVAVPTLLKAFVTDTNIIIDATVQDSDSGTLDLVCYWKPLSADGNLVAA